MTTDIISLKFDQCHEILTEYWLRCKMTKIMTLNWAVVYLPLWRHWAEKRCSPCPHKVVDINRCAEQTMQSYFSNPPCTYSTPCTDLTAWIHTVRDQLRPGVRLITADTQASRPSCHRRALQHHPPPRPDWQPRTVTQRTETFPREQSH